jgi:hypothetical protein
MSDRTGLSRGDPQPQLTAGAASAPTRRGQTPLASAGPNGGEGGPRWTNYCRVRGWREVANHRALPEHQASGRGWSGNGGVCSY